MILGESFCESCTLPMRPRANYHEQRESSIRSGVRPSGGPCVCSRRLRQLQFANAHGTAIMIWERHWKDQSALSRSLGHEESIKSLFWVGVGIGTLDCRIKDT